MIEQLHGVAREVRREVPNTTLRRPRQAFPAFPQLPDLPGFFVDRFSAQDDIEADLAMKEKARGKLEACYRDASLVSGQTTG